MRRLTFIAAFFGVRVAAGLLLLKVSAHFLPAAGFTVFFQLLLLAALLNTLAIGGAQGGLIRQAAADGGSKALARTQGAAFLIWGASAAILALATVLAAGPFSRLLTGAPDHGLAIIGVAALSLSAGPGQIWCGLLSGRGRTIESLSAQALGLLGGTAAAASLIVQGAPILAALAFAGGGLLTMAAAFGFATRLRIPTVAPCAARAGVAPLMRYAAALLATTGFSAAALFGLRAFYRDAFGLTELGYWMAANRISDMSTQLLGLVMLQAFVPRFAATSDLKGRRRMVIRFWALGAAVMAAALIVFSLASEPLVRLFLSEAFLPAAPVIQAYMVGDLLRVWTCLAMYAAFAQGRPGRYAAIEITVMGAMAVLAAGLIAAGKTGAPQLAYVSAQAIAAGVASLAFVLAARPVRPRP